MNDTEDWREDAKCSGVNPNYFFPEVGWDAREVARFCLDCPVAADCLEYALENRIVHGVWGGKSERQRKNLLRYRRRSVILEHMEPEPPVHRKVV